RTHTPPHSALFPYTTLFRSHCRRVVGKISEPGGRNRLADRGARPPALHGPPVLREIRRPHLVRHRRPLARAAGRAVLAVPGNLRDRKSTRLNSSHSQISYAV